MTISVGDKIPSATFITMSAEGPQKIDSSEYFQGKRVVLFSVPGAFTPTCSAQHLPSFIENAEAIKAKAVDAIACTAVNDPFVMGAWGASAGAAGKVDMLADGNGEFAKALGLEMDGSAFGLGTRGQRFALVAKDGVVEKLFVEEAGAYKVSSAEHILDNL